MVLSPANWRVGLDEKAAAYLAAGAVEVWLVAEDGTIVMLAASGPIDVSALGMDSYCRADADLRLRRVTAVAVRRHAQRGVFAAFRC